MKKLKWGLIGCGDIARKRVAPALRDLPNSDFIAVSRARHELAESFAVEFGAYKWYGTWQELIDDEEIEAVYVATPVYLHCEQTVAAAEAGKHVLCEKPMGMNASECERMIEVCCKAGVKLGVAYYRHFYPVIGRIKEILATGEIGRAVFAEINAFEYFNPSPDHDRYWFVMKEKAGGGPMFDFGCHRIEVLLNIFGPVTFTEGFIDTIVLKREVEDTATAFFRFASGTNAVLNISHAVYEPRDTLEIYCTEGSLHVPVLNNGVMTIITCNGERTEDFPQHLNVHQPLIDDFIRAVLDNRKPLVDGEIGSEVNRIEEDIYKNDRY